MTMPALTSFESARRAMVEDQIRRRGITDQRVLQAMLDVPRHEFAPPQHLAIAYADQPIPLGEGQAISQPYIVAAMTQAVALKPGERVLEVGTGSGYQAAILVAMGAVVYTLERDPVLTSSARERLRRLRFSGVEALCRDGTEGYPEAAPYDVIMVTAAAPRIPPTLQNQLAEGGRMIIPVGDPRYQALLLITRAGSQFTTRALESVQFVPLFGKEGWSDGSYC
jgi:protein-L-isoaspartate(D-aspartate) O-methyltransferase